MIALLLAVMANRVIRGAAVLQDATHLAVRQVAPCSRWWRAWHRLMMFAGAGRAMACVAFAHR